MNGAKNVCKIIKKVILEMMLHNQLGVESSGFHVVSFLRTCGSLPFSHLSLTSPSPLPSQSPSTLTIFRTDERVRIDVHTRAQSTFLLNLAMMTCFEGQGLSPGNDQLALRTWFWCYPSGKWSSSTGDLGPLCWQIVFLFLSLKCPLPNDMVAWVVDVEGREGL